MILPILMPIRLLTKTPNISEQSKTTLFYSYDNSCV